MAIGEIRLFAGNFAPQGWKLCDGKPLQIDQNRELFNELKTKYGGDGRTTFWLPDLRGRAPMHRAAGAALGTTGKIPVDAARPNHDHGRLALNFIIAIQDPDLPGDEPYIGEVRPFGFNFAPQKWARCNGAALSIASNETLYFLIETKYGGDGQRTFNLPDLSDAFPYQPQSPDERGKIGGAQVNDQGTPQQATLLAVNYCIAVAGRFPQREQ